MAEWTKDERRNRIPLVSVAPPVCGLDSRALVHPHQSADWFGTANGNPYSLVVYGVAFCVVGSSVWSL